LRLGQMMMAHKTNLKAPPEEAQQAKRTRSFGCDTSKKHLQTNSTDKHVSRNGQGTRSQGRRLNAWS